MIIAVASDHHFAKLCEIIGQPDLIKNPKFDSDPHRSENDVELKAILENFFGNHTVAEAMEMMSGRMKCRSDQRRIHEGGGHDGL